MQQRPHLLSLRLLLHAGMDDGAAMPLVQPYPTRSEAGHQGMQQSKSLMAPS